MKTHEYAFDIKLFAAIRIEAASGEEARKKLAELLDSATCLLCISDVERIEFEASVDDSEMLMFEIDGKPV